MDKLPSHIGEYLLEQCRGDETVALLQLDAQGAILDGYGALFFFNAAEPVLGSDVYSYCSILEGILPLESRHAVLPHIEMQPDRVFADIHLLFHADCYWIVFIDSTHRVETMREFLQMYNQTNYDNQRQKREQIADNPQLAEEIEKLLPDEMRAYYGQATGPNPPDLPLTPTAALDQVSPTAELPPSNPLPPSTESKPENPDGPSQG